MRISRRQLAASSEQPSRGGDSLASGGRGADGEEWPHSGAPREVRLDRPR